MDFISKAEWSEIGFDEKAAALINEGFNRVYNRATEDNIRRMPSLVARLLASVPANKKHITDFYEKYPEFKDHLEIVAKVVTDLDNKNPGATYGKLLELAEPIIRQSIHNKKTALQIPTGLPKNVKKNGRGVL